MNAPAGTGTPSTTVSVVARRLLASTGPSHRNASSMAAPASDRSPRTAASLHRVREEAGEQHRRRAEGRVAAGVDELPQERDGHFVGERFAVDLGGREDAHHVATRVPSRRASSIAVKYRPSFADAVERIRHVRVGDDLCDRQLVEGVDVVARQAQHAVDDGEGVRARELLDELRPARVAERAERARRRWGRRGRRPIPARSSGGTPVGGFAGSCVCSGGSITLTVCPNAAPRVGSNDRLEKVTGSLRIWSTPANESTM